VNTKKLALILFVGLLTAGLLSCGNGKRVSTTMRADAPAPTTVQQVEWPAGLPADMAQPWETLDGAGRVVSSINLQSQFVPGVERFLEAGSVSNFGEASRMQSGAPGDENISWSIYRIPMGAEQPGTIAADVNLRLTSTNTESEYYIGVGDYSANTWHWNGPFSVSHVRFNVPSAAYTSGLGNLMLAVVAYDGADFDLVGLGVNARDNADTTPPPAPSAPTLTPMAGGVLAEWVPVVAADLAGYRVYADGKNSFDYIEGGTSAFIPATADVALTLSAVDVSGNESAQSDASNSAPLTGSAPVVSLTAGAASGRRGDIISLNASGAASYDWDVNGDGNWDITGDTTGTAFANTTNMGIIRPALRAHAAGGGFWMGAVSLIIAGNSRPVVSATVDVASGVAPLAVNFTLTAEDDDGTIAEYAWDFEGDGIYDGTSATNPSPLPNTYSTANLYNAKFRVTDNEGSWDVDTVSINATKPPDPPGPAQPTAALTATPMAAYIGENGTADIQFDASASTDPSGGGLTFVFDPEGIGPVGYVDNGTVSTIGHSYIQPGTYLATVYVTDSNLVTVQASVQIQVYKFNSNTIDTTVGAGYYNSTAVINGNPAVAYHDNSILGLVYMRANDPEGITWAPRVVVDVSTYTGGYPSLCTVQGRPAIGYYEFSSGSVMYIRANDKNGEDWPAPTVVDSVSLAYGYTSMAVVDGRPAIAFVQGLTSKLLYVRASDSFGTTWGTPPVVADDSGFVLQDNCRLIVANGSPAVAYLKTSGSTNNYAAFVRADDMDGTTWGTPQYVTFIEECSGFISAAIVNGFPAISWYNGSYSTLVYIRATDGDGASWGPPVEPDPTIGDIGAYTSLTCVNGQPVICYRDSFNGYLRFIAATDGVGNSWLNPQLVDTQVYAGEYASMCAVGNRLAIAYRDVSNGMLRFAMGSN
jgi:hypothetical protein